MANPDQLRILKQGSDTWNKWRIDFPNEKADLSREDLSHLEPGQYNFSQCDLGGSTFYKLNLIGPDFSGADFYFSHLVMADFSMHLTTRYGPSFANFSSANFDKTQAKNIRLNMANFSNATLIDSDFSNADFSEVNLSGANIKNTNLSGTNFNKAILTGIHIENSNLEGANLSGVDLSGSIVENTNLRNTIMVKTNLQNTKLTSCSIYGIAPWDVAIEGSQQIDLNISDYNQTMITVDNLEVAQFLYLLLNNQRLRNVIDTITSKVVLILGRFTKERKLILDAIRDALRGYGYLPVLFDFEKPTGRDLSETIATLAHMAKFIIADITDAKSIPQELTLIIPNLPSVPVQPILLASEKEYSMFEHFQRYPWVLNTLLYQDLSDLISFFPGILSNIESIVKDQVVSK